MAQNTNQFVLIKTNDFYSADNIKGRVQNAIFESYEEAYNVMKDEVVTHLKHETHDDGFLQAVLDHVEFSNVYLGVDEARYHCHRGKLNYYWEIIEV